VDEFVVSAPPDRPRLRARQARVTTSETDVPVDRASWIGHIDAFRAGPVDPASPIGSVDTGRSLAGRFASAIARRQRRRRWSRRPIKSDADERDGSAIQTFGRRIRRPSSVA